jgi:hypothetical protein
MLDRQLPQADRGILFRQPMYPSICFPYFSSFADVKKAMIE